VLSHARSVALSVRRTHVYKLSGPYVGELHEDMVVNRYLGNLGNIGSSGNPGNLGMPGKPGIRGVCNYGYPDKSGELFGEDAD